MNPARHDEIPAERRIFCNRTLNLRGIGAIGYDMDYTLIQYRVAEWEGCAFKHAVDLLRRDGVPVDDLSFDPLRMIQGLIVDRQHGNLLKVNRFGFVKGAWHGQRAVDFETVRRLYARTLVDHRDTRFAFLSTLFSLSESSLYAQMVDLWDAGQLPAIADYDELYLRTRGSVDDAHRLGHLKAEIVADPDRFIDPDADTVRALLDQREAGKKLLLVTNSDFAYTQRMMRHTFEPLLPAGSSWRELFDLIIVSARKPDFFSSRSPLLQVVSDDGLLRPVEGAPVPGAVYFGGNAALVESALNLSGDQILYVGDHFFGDVHATKNVLRWRTALIVRELELEILEAARFLPQERELVSLMQNKQHLEEWSCALRVRLQRSKSRRVPLARPDLDEVHAELARLREQQEQLEQRIGPLASSAAKIGNDQWGPLMRAGNDKSYLAFLIERHADIYTSRVSNFLHATPYAYFRSARGSLPHDVGG
ncbi:MAG: HAD-IG family 5'-nucleotidase [Pseudomonadota bacterium]